jgi:hypothetical protein
LENDTTPFGSDTGITAISRIGHLSFRYMLALAAKIRPKIETPKQLREFRIMRLDKRRGFEKRNLCLLRHRSYDKANRQEVTV